MFRVNVHAETHSSKNLLTILSVSIALGVMAFGSYILLQSRNDVWREAEQASDNLVLALGRDIVRNIGVYDLSLQGAAEAWTQPGLDQTTPTIRRMALFDRASSAEYLGSIIITGAQGEVLADSTSDSPHEISLADREHFQVHQKMPDVGLFISRPFQARLVKAPIIALSRRINTEDGQFAGVVVGAMRLAYFQDLFAKLNIGQGGSVTLFRADGRVIMRHPFHERDIDQDLGSTKSFLAYLKEPQGHLVGTSTLDGTRRLYTFQRLGNLPLILSVALAADDIYAAWWARSVGIGVMLVLLSGSTIALCFLFRREIKRRVSAETNLLEAADNLSALAATDGLTGIPNRRTFDAALTQEWRRARRAETSVALLMLDADWFKGFNDCYGHQQGDDVLRKIAACIQGKVRRPGDTAARYGGEEFVVLLAETDLQGALVVAAAIHKSIADLQIPHTDAPMGFVSVSIGVAVAYPASEDDESVLVEQADEALYEAKRAGRNQVIVFRNPNSQAVPWEPVRSRVAHP